MVHLIVESLIKIVSYSLFMYGLWLLVGEPFLKGRIDSGVRNFKSKRKIKKLHQLNKQKVDNQKGGVIQEHLSLLLGSLSSNTKENNVSKFVMNSLILFSVSFMVVFITVEDILIALSFALLIGGAPYLIARFLLARKRLQTSMTFLNEFYLVSQNYQAAGKDAYYTVMNVVKDTDDKKLKNTYMKLVSAMQTEREPEAFNKAVTIFAYTINSTFSKRFAKLIEKAHMDHADISIPLQQMSDDTSTRKERLSSEKTEKAETVLLGIVPVITLPLFVFGAYQVSGVRDFFHYFTDQTSLVLFFVSLLCTIICVFLAYLFSKPRADI